MCSTDDTTDIISIGMMIQMDTPSARVCLLMLNNVIIERSGRHWMSLEVVALCYKPPSTVSCKIEAIKKQAILIAEFFYQAGV